MQTISIDPDLTITRATPGIVAYRSTTNVGSENAPIWKITIDAQ